VLNGASIKARRLDGAGRGCYSRHTEGLGARCASFGHNNSTSPSPRAGPRACPATFEGGAFRVPLLNSFTAAVGARPGQPRLLSPETTQLPFDARNANRDRDRDLSTQKRDFRSRLLRSPKPTALRPTVRPTVRIPDRREAPIGGVNPESPVAGEGCSQDDSRTAPTFAGTAKSVERPGDYGHSPTADGVAARSGCLQIQRNTEPTPPQPTARSDREPRVAESERHQML